MRSNRSVRSSDTMFQWNTETMFQWHTDTMFQWHTETMFQWHTETMFQWNRDNVSVTHGDNVSVTPEDNVTVKQIDNVSVKHRDNVSVKQRQCFSETETMFQWNTENVSAARQHLWNFRDKRTRGFKWLFAVYSKEQNKNRTSCDAQRGHQRSRGRRNMK